MYISFFYPESWAYGYPEVPVSRTKRFVSAIREAVSHGIPSKLPPSSPSTPNRRLLRFGREMRFAGEIPTTRLKSERGAARGRSGDFLPAGFCRAPDSHRSSGGAAGRALFWRGKWGLTLFLQLALESCYSLRHFFKLTLRKNKIKLKKYCTYFTLPGLSSALGRSERRRGRQPRRSVKKIVLPMDTTDFYLSPFDRTAVELNLV